MSGAQAMKWSSARPADIQVGLYFRAASVRVADTQVDNKYKSVFEDKVLDSVGFGPVLNGVDMCIKTPCYSIK